MSRFESLLQLWGRSKIRSAGARHNRVRSRRFSMTAERLEDRRMLAAPDSRGTDFWLAFNENLGSDALNLFIAGESATSGTVEIPGLAFSSPFSVTPGNVTTVMLPNTALLSGTDSIENKGIHVTSVDEVTVYGLNRVQFTTDAFLGLPTDILGTEYINLGWKNVDIVNGSEFGVVATADGTVVTITPSVTTGARTVGVPYDIMLNQGQTYQLRNTVGGGSDLSGSIITSNLPIAVFGAHQCANIPSNNFVACDHIIEQLPPTSTWGQSFVTMPLATRVGGDTFRILAGTDNTTVTINGSVVATINRGQIHEQIIDGPATITTSNPALVAQYSNGSSFDGITSDPFMMLVSPFEQFLGSYTVTTPASGFAQNFINVVAPASAIGFLTLDGAAIAPASFTPIGSSGFSGAQLVVGLGAHTLGDSRPNGAPFGISVYGFDSFDSYGYPGGLSLAPIASATSLSLTPVTADANVGDTQTLTATVLDNEDQPLAGIRVDFNITGANPQSGFAITDAQGVATFIYTGTNPGVDNVVASVGELADTATIVWGGVGSAPIGLLVLSPNGVNSLSVTGNGGIFVPQGAVTVNSNKSNAALISGNGGVTAGDINVTGGAKDTGQGNYSPAVDQEPPTADPLNLPLPPAPGPSFPAVVYTGSSTLVLQPGTYVGGIKLLGSGSIVLEPGVYYLQGGGLTVSGTGSFIGVGVTIVNAPSSRSGGSITFSGSGNVVLTPRTVPTGDDEEPDPLDAYLGITLMQDPASNLSIVHNGSGQVYMRGTVYAPGAPLFNTGDGNWLVNDSDGQATVIVREVHISGQGSLIIRPLATPGTPDAAVQSPGSFAFFNASTSTFAFPNPAGSELPDLVFNYGAPNSGFAPLFGDWDGDGSVTPGFYDPATATWHLKNTLGGLTSDEIFNYGLAGADWIPIVGDWDGNGVDGIGFYDPGTATWFLKNAHAQGLSDETFNYGAAGAAWLPIVGDWDGNGVDGVGFYDSSTATWFLKNDHAQGLSDETFNYGAAGAAWVPLVGDWDADGDDDIGFFDPATGTWFLKHQHSQGVSDQTFTRSPKPANWRQITDALFALYS